MKILLVEDDELLGSALFEALTPKGYSLLELFLRNPQRVFSRSAIIDRLWSLDGSPAESAVTVHIKELRQKLKTGGMTEEIIETVYGLGYRLKSPRANGNCSRSAGFRFGDAYFQWI